MAKFQVHAPPNILELQHRPSPRRTGDRHLNRGGTEFRMARQQSFAPSQQHRRIAVMHGLNIEHGRGRKVVENNSAFNFRLDDGVIHVIREIGVRAKHHRASIRVMGFQLVGKGCLRATRNLGSGYFWDRLPALSVTEIYQQSANQSIVWRGLPHFVHWLYSTDCLLILGVPDWREDVAYSTIRLSPPTSSVSSKECDP